MKVTFRQGIARYQTDINSNPIFLQKSTTAGFIDLVVSPDPTVIVFAHKSATYIFEEVKSVKNAWGPLTVGTIQYLYWDVNVLTGELTRGIAAQAPIISGTAPTTPAIGQHWFDALNTVMKVWETPGRWVEKIRVFAGYVTSGAIIKPYALGTQVGINGEFDVGNIILDAYYKPLRQSDGSFLTTVTTMSVPSMSTRRISFENEVMQLMATEYIAKNQLVRIKQGRKCALAQSADTTSRVVGIATEDMYLGETSPVVTFGIVRNSLWNWSADSIGKALFASATGELTLSPVMQGVHQKVGTVYDTDAIFVRVEPAIVLDDPDGGIVEPLPPDPTVPVADFMVVGLATTGEAPFTVQFQDLSLHSPTAWEWDFTNDGNIDATIQNPSYTYSTPGTYSVRLKAINGFGTGQTIKNGLITVNAAPSTGTFTNLEINLGGPTQVNRGGLFTAIVTVRNDGYLTATNVSRVIEVLDVQGLQVVPSGLPAGSVVTRSTSGTARTIITLPPIISLAAANAPVVVAFTLQAPAVSNQSIRINASVSSPETDSQTGDNTVSLYVRVV